MSKGTPLSSQIVWLEGRVKELEEVIERLRTGDTCARQCEGTAYRIKAQDLKRERDALLRAVNTDYEQLYRETLAERDAFAQQVETMSEALATCQVSMDGTRFKELVYSTLKVNAAKALDTSAARKILAKRDAKVAEGWREKCDALAQQVAALHSAFYDYFNVAYSHNVEVETAARQALAIDTAAARKILSERDGRLLEDESRAISEFAISDVQAAAYLLKRAAEKREGK